jgi:dipeptidase E
VNDRLRLLLLSDSRNPGAAYLAHARDAILEWLGAGRGTVLFVPYAGVTGVPAEYASKVAEILAPWGIQIRSIAEAPDPVAAVGDASAIMVGGGNTFQLLKRCQESGILPAVRDRVRAGLPYLGWSAGANLACPTIKTTNDMPIVQPASFNGLDLVPFQINPHYTDLVLPGHGGETRDERIAEFLVLNPAVPVVGLREGSWLRVDGRRVALGGPHTLRLFEAGRSPREIGTQAELAALLAGPGPARG